MSDSLKLIFDYIRDSITENQQENRSNNSEKSHQSLSKSV